MGHPREGCRAVVEVQGERLGAGVSHLAEKKRGGDLMLRVRMGRRHRPPELRSMRESRIRQRVCKCWLVVSLM